MARDRADYFFHYVDGATGDPTETTVDDTAWVEFLLNTAVRSQHATTIQVLNDDGADVLGLSFDGGTTVHDRLKAQESRSYDFRPRHRVHLKNLTAAGGNIPYRLAAWRGER